MNAWKDFSDLPIGATVIRKGDAHLPRVIKDIDCEDTKYQYFVVYFEDGTNYGLYAFDERLEWKIVKTPLAHRKTSTAKILDIAHGLFRQPDVQALLDKAIGYHRPTGMFLDTPEF